ncbi:MAG: hypothetical protein HKM89_15120 [Gemmatimonadales bacterium]|nr:hypothetical protein [Gemmatimonadales bacterium]
MTNESATTEDLTAAVERRAGVKLASESSAAKTAAAIKDLDSCYEDIFGTAAAEVGVDHLVSRILDTNQPSWAQHALTYVPDLSESQREALAQKASVVIGTANSLELYLAGGAAFEAKFTMFWRNKPGDYVLPNAATPDEGKWKWSIKLSIAINRSYTISIPDFAIDNAPVDVGATCWMVAQVVGGPRRELTDHSFTYQPGGPNRRFNTIGVVNTPKFCLQDYPEKGDCRYFKP